MTTRYLDPQADDVRDEHVATIGGTPATGNSVSVEIADAVTTFYVGDDVTTSEIAAHLVSALIATSRTYNLTDGRRSNGGYEKGPFRAITAAAEDSDIRLVSINPGHKFTPTGSVSGGGVTLSSFTNEVVATGKGFADNINNWGGAIASNNDTLNLANTSQSMTDGFAAYNSIAGLSMDVLDSYLGNIGRSRTNTDDASYPYPEKLPTHLPLGANTGVDQTINLGEFNGTASIERFAYLDLGSASDGGDLIVNVNNYPSRGADGSAPVDIIGGYTMQMDCVKGAVDIGTRMDEAVCNNIKAMTVRADGDVWIGPNSNILSSATRFHVYGKLRLSVSHGSMDITVYDGGHLILQDDFGDSDEILIKDGGKIETYDVVIDSLTMEDDATIDATNDPGSTITELIVYGQPNWNDPKGRLTVNPSGSGSPVGTGQWLPPTS